MYAQVRRTWAELGIAPLNEVGRWVQLGVSAFVLSPTNIFTLQKV